jgi:hypothetical protein
VVHRGGRVVPQGKITYKTEVITPKKEKKKKERKKKK